MDAADSCGENLHRFTEKHSDFFCGTVFRQHPRFQYIILYWGNLTAMGEMPEFQRKHTLALPGFQRRKIMDQFISEEQKAVKAESAPNKKAKPTFTIQLGRFHAEIGDDVAWFWDIRLWSPVLAVLLIAALLAPVRKAPVASVVETPVPEIVEQTIPVDDVVIPEVKPEVRDPEAEALARLADTVGSGRTDRVKKVIMWVAINRSEDRANGFGKSLAEEIARPNQWQFYDEAAPYGEGSYLLAQEVLKMVRTNDLRPVDKDMLWLLLNDDGSVTIRNGFNINSKTVQKTFK